VKRGHVRQLLIDPDPEIRFAATDRGVVWVSDRYVIARWEVFARPPSARSLLAAPVLRRVLHSACAGKARRVAAADTGRRVDDRGGPRALIGVKHRHLRGYVSSPYVAVNAGCWDAWAKTGLTPMVSGSGDQILWFGNVGGHARLFGVVMCASLGRTP